MEGPRPCDGRPGARARPRVCGPAVPVQVATAHGEVVARQPLQRPVAHRALVHHELGHVQVGRERDPPGRAVAREALGEQKVAEVGVERAHVPVSGLARRFVALGGPLEGWRVASKGWGRCSGSARGRGWGRGGGGALPLPRAAVISTRVRVRNEAARERGVPLSKKVST